MLTKNPQWLGSSSTGQDVHASIEGEDEEDSKDLEEEETCALGEPMPRGELPVNSTFNRFSTPLSFTTLIPLTL